MKNCAVGNTSGAVYTGSIRPVWPKKPAAEEFLELPLIVFFRAGQRRTRAEAQDRENRK